MKASFVTGHTPFTSWSSHLVSRRFWFILDFSDWNRVDVVSEDEKRFPRHISSPSGSKFPSFDSSFIDKPPRLFIEFSFDFTVILVYFQIFLTGLVMLSYQSAKRCFRDTAYLPWGLSSHQMQAILILNQPPSSWKVSLGFMQSPIYFRFLWHQSC